MSKVMRKFALGGGILVIIGLTVFVSLTTWHLGEPSLSTSRSVTKTSTHSPPTSSPTAHPIPSFTNNDITEQTIELGRDTKHYTRINNDLTASLLWLTLTYDAHSWGRHLLERRGVDDLLRIISSQIEVDRVHLGLLTSSRAEYDKYVNATRALNFAKVSVILHPGFLGDGAFDRSRRHDEAIQTLRRGEIAKLRNYLMLKTQGFEEHTLWLDADVYKLDAGIVEQILRHADSRPDAGIITARCSHGWQADWDYNAWRGTRKGPKGWQLTEQEIATGELQKQGQHHVAAVIKGSTDDELLKLTTVGATILYIRSELVWQGLTFPTQYVVGTRWGKDGWDGIESEGLCYMARSMAGGNCMVLGGSWHIEHTIW